ncbi:MAG: hypothetical protein GY804_12535 [Alphaproteobacteria bacterium]|nr:hypothetical protein [Alphaproteobacteria bacterium]
MKRTNKSLSILMAAAFCVAGSSASLAKDVNIPKKNKISPVWYVTKHKGKSIYDRKCDMSIVTTSPEFFKYVDKVSDAHDEKIDRMWLKKMVNHSGLVNVSLDRKNKEVSFFSLGKRNADDSIKLKAGVSKTFKTNSCLAKEMQLCAIDVSLSGAYGEVSNKLRNKESDTEYGYMNEQVFNQYASCLEKTKNKGCSFSTADSNKLIRHFISGKRAKIDFNTNRPKHLDFTLMGYTKSMKECYLWVFDEYSETNVKQYLDESSYSNGGSNSYVQKIKHNTAKRNKNAKSIGSSIFGKHSATSSSPSFDLLSCKSGEQKVVDFNGTVVGCSQKDGTVIDGSGKRIGKKVAGGAVINDKNEFFAKVAK